MYKSYIPYLKHILAECHYITSVITDDMALYQFLSDKKFVPLQGKQHRFSGSIAVTFSCDLLKNSYLCRANNI